MPNVAVHYYLGYVDWQVNFYAVSTTGNPAGSNPPIDTIKLPHGGTADANWTPDNTPPPALDRRVSANGYVSWQ